MDMSDKRSGRVGEELAKDTRGGDEAREHMRSDDSRPLVVQQNEGVMDDHDAERRSALARAIEPSAFPARPSELEATAAKSFADDGIIRALQSLPDRVYDNIQDVWSTLGGPIEEKRA